MSSDGQAVNSGETSAAGGGAATPDGYHLMLDIDGDFALFTLDAGGHIKTWSPAAERITGYCPAEIIGKPLSALHLPESKGLRQSNNLLSAATSAGQAHFEGWHLRKDGTRFWANVVVSALCDRPGDLAGFAAVTLDASERHLYEAKLRRSEERLRLMIASVRDYAVFMLSPEAMLFRGTQGHS
jgi:PAS domain S-box-containing protein